MGIRRPFPNKGRSASSPVVQPVYNEGKELAKRIFFETMAAIDVRQAMLSKVQRGGEELHAGEIILPLTPPPRVVAFGKAAIRMSSALYEILGGGIEAGVVVAPELPQTKIQGFRYFVGGHPYPTTGSQQGAEAALELVSELNPDDLVIFLVSGGGSALFEKPLDPAVTLAALVEFNRVLVTCGLPIEQMNVLRKHISAVKGGRLATRAYPARQLTIYISDVPSQHISMVASGPTLPDESTVEESYGIAGENNLVSRFPPAIRNQFERRLLQETPKASDREFRSSSYFCLLSNRDAVEAAIAAATRRGFKCEVDSGNWDTDYREVVRKNVASLDALAAEHRGEPVCLVLGGEVVSTVTGTGSGGRNQAFVLYAAEQIADRPRVVLSAGTDGRDGNSPAAGAVADGRTISRAHSLRLDPADYLVRSDSYSFFRALGDTLETGFTDNNVRDLRLWLDFST